MQVVLISLCVWLSYLDSTDSGYDGGEAILGFFDNIRTSADALARMEARVAEVFGFFTGPEAVIEFSFINVIDSYSHM